MSASPWMVQPDIDHITKMVKDFGAEVVQETNKRIIMWCPTLYCAKQVALHIKRDGYHYEIKQGNKSKAWYVQAFY